MTFSKESSSILTKMNLLGAPINNFSVFSIQKLSVALAGSTRFLVSVAATICVGIPHN
jgi:hypothetical protein